MPTNRVLSLSTSNSLVASTRLLMASLALFTATLASAQVVWDGGGNGSTWGDNLNWIGDVKPTGSDSVQLDGATVTVDTAESYTGFSATGTNGFIIVNSGGELTANANSNAFRHIDGLTINTGGLVIASPTANIRSGFLMINDGGELTGTNSVFDADTLTVGGEFRPMDAVDGNNTFRIGSATTGGSFIMASTGTLYLDLYGDGVNEDIVIDDRDAIVSDLDLSTGSIILSTQGGYTPQIGDSYDLWTDLMTGGVPNNVIPGDGSNISLVGYQLDLSQWATDGVVSVVPEPNAIVLVALVGLSLVYLRRRK